MLSRQSSIQSQSTQMPSGSVLSGITQGTTSSVFRGTPSLIYVNPKVATQAQPPVMTKDYEEYLFDNATLKEIERFGKSSFKQRYIEVLEQYSSTNDLQTDLKNLEGVIGQFDPVYKPVVNASSLSTQDLTDLIINIYNLYFDENGQIQTITDINQGSDVRITWNEFVRKINEQIRNDFLTNLGSLNFNAFISYPSLIETLISKFGNGKLFENEEILTMINQLANFGNIPLANLLLKEVPLIAPKKQPKSMRVLEGSKGRVRLDINGKGEGRYDVAYSEPATIRWNVRDGYYEVVQNEKMAKFRTLKEAQRFIYLGAFESKKVLDARKKFESEERPKTVFVKKIAQ